MKRFLNILVVLIFVNFLALPSIAKVFDIHITTTNIIFSEEENTVSQGFVYSEKNIPKTLYIHDYIKFFEPIKNPKKFTQNNEDTHVSPHLSIFSPPPEFFI